MATTTPVPVRPRALDPIWLVWLGVLALALLSGLSLARYGYVYAGPRWGVRGATLLPALVYTTVGALVLSRHRRHPVGLLLLWTGVGSALQTALEEYATYGLLIGPGRLPGALFVAWVCNWIWIPVDGVAASLLPLFFPNGHLPSRRWRWVEILAFVGLGIMCVGFGVQPGKFGSMIGLFDNPYGLTWFGDRSAEVAGWIMTAGELVFLVSIILAVLSLLLRLRRAQGVERQQLKWFVYAAAMVAILSPVNVGDNVALQLFYLLCTTALPVAIGLAVLRYRLYDIDVLVNRTLVYGALTAILAGVYFGSVVLLQSLLAALTGESRSGLVTVLSTLTIAALFNPLRRRVQAFIDRRFYRAKYDAARTLAGFSATARDDVDLNTLNDRLVAVVHDTMQPVHVELWVRDPEGPAG